MLGNEDYTLVFASNSGTPARKNTKQPELQDTNIFFALQNGDDGNTPLDFEEISSP